ncbi:ATP synthase subunit I [Desulfobacca acetoxidans]|uniref:ATP synthase subunit I n=1 Tax=Desulfobacca acetoxidans (strain ATCC 700848 / DSM 11109 / ASRB2) TaxID=880072 RepID=F2NE54_DESAR|nr:ATP synthase subunit I [Desulfobacca acetoxidans]AEB10684.1 hypothetical protein Desac_2884 [Desulfobacca acetoxidans DSM 11109]
MSGELLTPRTMKLSCWITLAALTCLGWLGRGPQCAGGILVGGLLIIGNFYTMAYILRSTLNRTYRSREEWQTAGRQAVFFMTLKYILRFSVLAVIIFFLVKYEWVDIFGLVLGLSTVMLTLIVLGIFEFRKIFFKEALAVDGTSNSHS